jgi:hypothetical protein
MAKCLHGSNNEFFGAAKHTTHVFPFSAEAIADDDIADSGGSMLLCRCS